jgi:hypothetical protein
MSARPDAIAVSLNGWRRRMRLQSLLHGLTAGGAAFALMLLVARPGMALIVGVVVAAWTLQRGWTHSVVDAASRLEGCNSLDNLVVTAAELSERPRPVRAELSEAITSMAAERLRGIDSARTVPIAQPAAVAVAVLAGCGLLLMTTMSDGLKATAEIQAGRGGPAAGASALVVEVTPPAYTKRVPQRLENPLQLTVLAGSRIRISAGERLLREWEARESASLELRVAEQAPPRFLLVMVVPDAPPMVRIHTPGRDTALAAPRGRIAIGVESADDIALRWLVVRFTKASGAGENVTFTEGEVPVAIDRAAEGAWRARADWSIDGLDLADGDVLVYRAVARDSNPAGAPVQSDAFLVEIGRAAEIASAGFALPTEERKYAISQQMVIYKTQQLIAERNNGLRGRTGGETWLEQTRMIGMEQRMVRAEVVFLSGGEIEDEVVEAEHSHELAEGRLENQGRAEMIRAINFMSRAEALLNDGNADEALVRERQALTSLERALDRRRYFLRTLPDRSRIDPSRRLAGERREARSWSRPPATSEPVAAMEQQRSVLQALAEASSGRRVADATLAARVAALDPSSAALQTAAVAIASAPDDSRRREAAVAAMTAVTADALARLPSTAPVRIDTDPLAGRVTDALTSARQPR